MSVKAAGVGHFQIPTAPAALTAVAQSATANTLGSAVSFGNAPSALYITGVHIGVATTQVPTYVQIQILVTASVVTSVIVPYGVSAAAAASVLTGFRPIFPPIPVANAAAITVKSASSVASAVAWGVSLECIAQSNVVDDGIAVGTVTTVTTVTNQLTAAAIATGVWQDAVAGDFTVASSVGKALYIANVAPGGAGGLMISGSNAGTTTLGALTVTGATTHTGNVVLSDGLTISAPSTLNRAGLDIAGNGTGAAIKAVAGATGIGFSIAGGATSGDGFKVTTTSGHGINLAPVGTSMHGLLATGGNGGTSDGIKAAAGTGGVDLRANITGNLVGTVSTLTTYTGNTPQTGDAYARLGAPAGASVSADVAAVKVDTAAVKVKTDFLPSVAAGGAGGVFIAGSNAATTVNFTGSLSGSVGSVTGAVGSVTGAVASVTGNVGGNVVGSVASVTARVTANTDQLAGQTVTAAAGVTFPTSVASPTNITAGTITTVTNLTNAPTAGDLTAAMKTSVTTAATAATPTAAAVTGAVGSVTAAVTVGTNNDKAGYALSGAGVQAIWDALTSALTTVGSIGKRIADNLDAAISSRSTYAGGDTAGTTTLLSRLSAGRATALDNLDAAISTRLAATSYTVPDNVSVAAIKTQTDQLAFTVAGQADVNIQSINDRPLTGTGAAGDLFTV